MFSKMLAYTILLALFSCTSRPSEPTVSNDTLSGSWSGDYDVGQGRREAIGVELRWEDGRLGGVVKSGFRSLPISEASFNPDSGAITIKFDAEGPGGRTVHYVVEGNVKGDSMTGAWTHDNQRGDFKVTKD